MAPAEQSITELLRYHKAEKRVGSGQMTLTRQAIDRLAVACIGTPEHSCPLGHDRCKRGS